VQFLLQEKEQSVHAFPLKKIRYSRACALQEKYKKALRIFSESGKNVQTRKSDERVKA